MRYRSPHEVTRSHFRVWKSGKKWLYAAATLLMVAGPLSNLSLPFIGAPLGVQEVKAATSTSGTLSPGVNVNTSNTSTPYGASDITNANNTTLTSNGTSYGSASNSPGVISKWDSTGTLTLTNSILNGAVAGIGGNWDYGNSWGTFNGPVDMTKNLELDFSMKAAPQSGTLNTATQVGNWLGAYFVPVGTTFTNTNVAGSPTNTAITGTKNGVFVGRNFGYDSTGQTIQMSQTDGSGNQKDLATQGNVVASGSTGDSVKITWTPTSTNATAGTTTGTLTFWINPLANNTAVTSLTQTVTMQNTMQMGFSGSNGDATKGGKGSKMTIYSVQSTTSAYPASKVTVNYVGKRVDGTTPSLGTSVITTKVSDIIGVSNGGTVTGTTYDYIAPQIQGYNISGFTSSQVTASNATSTYVAASGTNPTITVTYTQQPTAYWNFNYANNTYGTLPPASSLATLSATASSAGMAFPIPTSAAAKPLIPGYHIAGYRAYNSSGANSYFASIPDDTWALPGASYADLSTAISAAVAFTGGKIGSNTPSSAPAFNTGVNSPGSYYANEIAIMVQANKESGAVQYSAAPGTTVASSALPSSVAISNAYGGYVGISSYSNATSSGATVSNFAGLSNAAFSVAALSSGYEYQGITAPDGKEYTGYTNFVAPSNTKSGSVTLYVRNTTTGSIAPSNVNIPPITIGAMRSGAYTDTTSYGALAAGSSGYGSSAAGATATSMTGLLQALGFAFPYGESGAPISNSNQFVVNVAPWQKLDYNGSYAVGTPGTGSGASSVAGSAFGNFNKISGYLSNATGAILGSEASSAGSAGKSAWLNYTSAVNSAASAAGASPVFTSAGTMSAAVSSMGYNVSLVAYNSAGTSSYFALTSAGFSNAANYAGPNYTSVVNGSGVEQDQLINLQFTPKSQDVKVVVNQNTPSYAVNSFTLFANSGYSAASSGTWNNATGALIAGTTNSAVSSGLMSSFPTDASLNGYKNSGTDNANQSTIANYSYAVTYSTSAAAVSSTSTSTLALNLMATAAAASSAYPTMTAALAANPYLDNVDGNAQVFTVNYVADKTSIYTSADQDSTPGSQTMMTGSWTPASGLVSYTNTDGTTTTNNVNGKTIQYDVYKAADVTDGVPNERASKVASGTDASQATELGKGDYVVIYTVKDSGQNNITAVLNLTVNSFALPFTGGVGKAVFIATAVALGIAGGLYPLMRKHSDLETKRK